jgi:PKD repeat protein
MAEQRIVNGNFADGWAGWSGGSTCPPGYYELSRYMHSSGEWYAWVYSKIPDCKTYIGQSVNFSGVDVLTIDARYYPNQFQTPPNAGVFTVEINGDVVFEGSEHYEHESISIDVSSYSGNCSLIISTTASVGGMMAAIYTVSAWYVAPTDPPIADFYAIPRGGPAPCEIEWVDASSGIVESWFWDFGNGITSFFQFPFMEYSENGLYTVSLTVTNAAGQNTCTKINYIAVGIPIAAFHATPLSGTAPLQVQFTDDSTNTPTSWIWDFGAGILSDLQNPLVTYLGAGTYTVKLIATNAAGSDQETKTDYITVAPPIPRYKPSWSLNICTPE